MADCGKLGRCGPSSGRSYSILANPLPAFSLPAISIFLNFARFSLFFTYRNAQQHTAILRRCLGVKDSKKVALVGCDIAPTKQTKVSIIQSQVQVQVCTSSFLQRVVCASPSSARRFSQDKADKKPKRKASFSVDNSRCRPSCSICTNPRPPRRRFRNFPRYPLRVLSNCNRSVINSSPS